jgi:hypothetical protein
MGIHDQHDQKENPLGINKPEGNFRANSCNEAPAEHDASPKTTEKWMMDVEQTIQLGEQFVGAVGGIVGLARTEALLAVRTLPKLMMLWLIIMPVILLTWCAFSALVAWSVFAASEEPGLGMLTFFLQQVVLLLSCRWLYTKYRTRMTLPYTRAQIDNFIRSTKDGLNGQGKTKE